MKKLSIKSGDTVVVLSGKDKGKQGKVMSVMPDAGKVVVEKINMKQNGGGVCDHEVLRP